MVVVCFCSLKMHGAIAVREAAVGGDNHANPFGFLTVGDFELWKVMRCPCGPKEGCKSGPLPKPHCIVGGWSHLVVLVGTGPGIRRCQGCVAWLGSGEWPEVQM